MSHEEYVDLCHKAMSSSLPGDVIASIIKSYTEVRLASMEKFT